jgi:pimeloyl-ACP methyl ester carboxylesterase
MSVKEWYTQRADLRFDTEKDDPGMMQWFASLVGETDADVIRAILRFLPDVDVLGLCQRIQVPTLILHPGQSLAVPEADAQTMHQAIRDSELVQFPDARHHVFMTHGEACAKEMLRFTQAHSAGTRT